MKLSVKSIASIVAGSTLVSGAAVAIPLSVTLVTKSAQEANAAAAGVTLQVPYNSDLIPPPSRPGYASPLLITTNYTKGDPVIETGKTADYRFIPDGTNPALETLYVQYKVVIVKAFVRPEQKSVDKIYVYRSPRQNIDTVPLADFPSRQNTGYLPWDYENPSWWRQTPAIQKIDFADVETLEVGNKFYALYSSKVDSTNYTGNSDTFRVYYSVVRSAAIAINDTSGKGEVKFGETVLPGANVVLPKLNEGYGQWVGPDYFDENNVTVDEKRLPKLTVGQTFKARWVAYVDRRFYGGADSVYEITYTVKPQPAPSPTPSSVEDNTTVIYGQTSLPKIPVVSLPALPPAGWLYWNADPVYYKDRSGTTPFTVADLTNAPAGTVFRAVYTNRPDSNYDSVPYQHVVIYTIARAKVIPDVHADAINNTLIIERQTAFPVYPSLPPPALGYMPWGAPSFATEAGVPITTGAQLSALAAGTVVYATYKSTVDSNHDGDDSIFRVKYTIAARP